MHTNIQMSSYGSLPRGISKCKTHCHDCPERINHIISIIKITRWRCSTEPRRAVLSTTLLPHLFHLDMWKLLKGQVELKVPI